MAKIKIERMFDTPEWKEYCSNYTDKPLHKVDSNSTATVIQQAKQIKRKQTPSLPITPKGIVIRKRGNKYYKYRLSHSRVNGKKVTAYTYIGKLD